ncbi:Serine/threonine-protein kinase PknD [Cellulomonas sp. T2.31MG-18]|uniref:protein kinase domain-containing protein n=1 Tax=Cellulomonas sp. T2.31MG-18 TaxID=3157619 RepID=UPI0035EDFFB3
MGATVTDPLVGRLVDGRYEVVSRLARGGMATVYVAVDRRLDRDVALKVMHPHLADGASGADFIARFRREARTAARLAHPGLVSVFDQGVDGETSYLTMELVTGVNLRRRIGEQGALTVGEALRIGEAVLDALTAAHRNGLVHRDVKPENVLLAAEDDRVKLADFGLARAVTEVTSTTTGTVLGTVAYLAPELVVRGASDARTDVYATGILLYEMLTGRQPFTGATPIQVAFQHVNSDVPAPSDLVQWLPSEVDELVAALTARDPADRPVDAGAALALLRRTRAALDPAVLGRHADVSPALPTQHAPESSDEDLASALGGFGSEGEGGGRLGVAAGRDEQVTTTLATVNGAGSTVALPIGLGTAAPGPTAGGSGGSPAATDVAAQRRSRWRRWPALLLAVLLIGGIAYGGWWYVEQGPGAYTTVPPITAQSEQQALAVLASHGLHGVRTEAYDDVAPAGQVFRSNPAVGQPVRKAGTVTYTVSRGVDLVTIPDGVVGAMQADAEKALKAAGLAVAYGPEQWHDTAAVGSVLSATLPDGAAADPKAQVKRGTTVTLSLSKGPAPVTVTTVVGATLDQATAQLAADGLKVAASEAFSDTVPAGTVMDQSPKAGSTAHRGDTVQVTVSKGQEMLPVPNVIQMKADKATKTLQDAGFTVAVTYPLGAHPLNTVYDQTPSGGNGKTAPRGSTITLSVV